MHPPEAGKRVIYVAVVDDDASVCRSFSRLLRVVGFQPVTYSSAEALLEDTRRPRFDCLVLDVQLEGMSGLELRDRLVAVRNFTPIIFLTAHDEPEVRTQALASNCAGYFRKSDPAEMVLEAIRRAVGLGHTPPPPRRAPRELPIRA